MLNVSSYHSSTALQVSYAVFCQRLTDYPQGNIKGDGVCCNEIDIWEANSRATSLAPHTCAKSGVFRCTGDECKGEGKCDRVGCIDNPYRERKAKDFYGPDSKVNTRKPFTVITGYPTDSSGVLKAITRKYIQDGKVIDVPSPNIVMDQAYCDASERGSQYNKFGGHKTAGQALARGMVLAMSVWWDEKDAMHWLDSGASGPCSETEGFPEGIKKAEPSPMVKFSNIKWGEIGSTHAVR
ncbi:hypothetical protein NX059_003063 [Plenodomus lindquistii]|nr:hypothetical protein NX059_003063 [Plenodomus lindquistii]